MPEPSAGPAIYRFGDFVLDTGRGLLLRGEVDVGLRRQSFDVLCLLVTNHGRVVGKEELHDAVWGRVAVTDDSLTHCISEIRKVLGDNGRAWVRTLPRRGYLFAADVRVAEVDTVAEPHQRSWRAWILAAAAFPLLAGIGWWLLPDRSAPLPPPNSIAVLPFVEQAGTIDDPPAAALGAVFSDELRDQISRVPGIRMKARSSSVAVVAQATDAIARAAQLGVAHVVEGTYRRESRALRISAQLIDGATGLTVWSQTYERRAAEMLAVQHAIAAAVVDILLPGETMLLSPATGSATANELMMIGRSYELDVRSVPEVDVAKLDTAIDYYRRATVVEPTNALAHTRLAGALLYRGDVAAAEQPVFRALELDAELSEVQETLGKFYWAREANEGAGQAWEAAVQLNPNNADALHSYGYWYWLQGNDDGPGDYFRRALELDPLSLERHGVLGEFLGKQGKVKELRPIISGVKDMFNSAEAFSLLARLFEFTGEVDRSIAWAIKARDRDPDEPAYRWQLAELYAIIDDRDTARRLEPTPNVGLLFLLQDYAALVEVGEERMLDDPGDLLLRFLLAFGRNALGDFENAMYILRSTGLPESAFLDRRPDKQEALFIYINALDGAGLVQEARGLAEWWLDRAHFRSDDWWISYYRSCASAILGRNREASDYLAKVRDSSRLIWRPLMRDARCMQKLAGQAAYEDLLHYNDERRAELRRRLPATLEELGVSL